MQWVRVCAFLVFLTPAGAWADPSTTSPEQGYDLGEVPAPRAIAMGGAHSALGGSTTAIYMNPASMLLAKVYHFEGIAAFSPEARRQTFAGAIADSVTNKMAGGISGAWSSMDADGIARQWTDLRIAGAYPLGDKLAMGVTGRYLRATQATGSGPLGASLASDGTKEDALVNVFTLDAGFTLLADEHVRVALAGHNLTHPANGFAPTTAVTGIGYSDEHVSVEGDVLVDFDTWGRVAPRGMLGGEYFFKDHYALRAGYRYDHGPRVHAASLGGAYIDKNWSIELSGRRDIVGDHPMTWMMVGLRYFYPVNQGGGEESESM